MVLQREGTQSATIRKTFTQLVSLSVKFVACLFYIFLLVKGCAHVTIYV